MTFSTLISFSTFSLKDRTHPSVENALFRLIKGLLVILERLVNGSSIDDINDLDGSKILSDIGLGILYQVRELMDL